MINNTHKEYLHHVIQETGLDSMLRDDMKIETVLSKAYKYLSGSYRCEYVFKNTVLNEILLSRHSLSEATYLTEFRVANTKADMLILNGTSTVYEIKSDVDNLNRVVNQVMMYSKIFDKVFVVSNEQSLFKIKAIIPKSIGIIILKEDLSIYTYREARSNILSIDKCVMFDSLRKPEYLSIIAKEFGYIPQAPTTLIHTVCKDLFLQLSNKKAHNYFVSEIRKRGHSNTQIKLVDKRKACVKGLLIDKNYSYKDCELIKFALSEKLINQSHVLPLFES